MDQLFLTNYDFDTREEYYEEIVTFIRCIRCYKEYLSWPERKRRAKPWLRHAEVASVSYRGLDEVWDDVVAHEDWHAAGNVLG